CIMSCVAGMVGGWLAGPFDRVFGPKLALQIEIGGSLIGLLGMLSTSPTMIFFAHVTPGQHIWDTPGFANGPELAFQASNFVSNVFQIAAWASARTLLTRLAPRDRLGTFFGLGALAGSCTGWIGPTLVAAFTYRFHSQQAGFCPVAALLTLGIVGLFFVRGGSAHRLGHGPVE